MSRKTIVYAVLGLLALSTVFVAPVAAQEESEDDSSEEEEEQTGILSGLAETLQDFTEGKSLTEILADTLWMIFFEPFVRLIEAILSTLADLLTYTPSVDGNPAVEEVHRDTLVVTYALSSLVFMAAGLLHMIGPVLGVSYKEVRKILPRLVVALAFATVSLPLLELGVEFTRALTTAFEPQFFDSNFLQRQGVTNGLAIAAILQSLLLVAVAVLFIIRDVYILFVAAISPLLALAWSLPRAKRYADTFISGWFAALLIAPLDMLVLKFSFALFSGAGTGSQAISNWLLGLAFPLLLLLVPKQVWDASQSALGVTYALAGGLKKGRGNSAGGQAQKSEADKLLSQEEKKRLRERRRKRRKGGGEK